MNASYWQSRNVLVTGATGFIGGHLVEKLVASGARVRAFVRYSSIGPLQRIGFLSPETLSRVEVAIGDLTDGETVTNAMSGVDTVFHLGALIAIPYSYHAPRSYVRTNVEGTLNVLLGAQARRVSRVVHLSTSEVYGSAQTVPMDELHVLAPQSPYAATKVGADKLAESFYKSFGVPVVTCRPFNTYGPRQTPRAVIPTIITQALRGDEIRLGSTTPTRDFNYVTDTVGGLMAVAAQESIVGDVLNLGTGREVSIADVISMVGEILGKRLSVVSEDERIRPEKSEVDRLLCDNRKVRALTGWAPEVPLEEGLRRTVDSMRAGTPIDVARYEL